MVTGNRVAFTYPTAGQQNINTITPFAGVRDGRTGLSAHGRDQTRWR